MARKRKQWDPADNAKIVHKYQQFMQHGKRLSETTVRLKVQAIDDFLDFTKNADFRSIQLGQIIAYKDDLFARKSERTGPPDVARRSAAKIAQPKWLLSLASAPIRISLPYQSD